MELLSVSGVACEVYGFVLNEKKSKALRGPSRSKCLSEAIMRRIERYMGLS